MQAFTIDALKKLPAFQQMFAEAEAEAIAKRAAEISEWVETDEQYRSEIDKLQAIVNKYRAAVDQKELELKHLTSQRDSSQLELIDMANRWTHKRKSAIERILAGADTRLVHFILWAQRAENLAQFAAYRAEPIAVVGLGESRQHAEAIKRAKTVSSMCIHAVERAEQMRLDAIAHEDVTDELTGMASAIREAYGPLSTFVGELPPDSVWLKP